MRPLISIADLASLLENSSLSEGSRKFDGNQAPVLLDLRYSLMGPPGIEAYRAGHIAGATYLDIDTDLASTPGRHGRHPLPTPSHLQDVLRSAGVNTGQLVVIYDDGDGSIAARGWWLLRWAGHEAVAVLDGGYAGWVEQGQPVTTEISVSSPGNFEVKPGGMPTLDIEQAAELARTGVLLDARASERYQGKVEPVDPRAGHIPGAISAPHAEHSGANQRWRAPAELAERFARLGVNPSTSAGVYCGSGVTASSVVLAAELAGRTEPMALYPGSWSEWSADPERPIATGELPG